MADWPWGTAPTAEHTTKAIFRRFIRIIHGQLVLGGRFGERTGWRGSGRRATESFIRNRCVPKANGWKSMDVLRLGAAFGLNFARMRRRWRGMRWRIRMRWKGIIFIPRWVGKGNGIFRS